MSLEVKLALISLAGLVLAALVTGLLNLLQTRVGAKSSKEAVTHLRGNGAGSHTEMLEAVLDLLSGIDGRLDSHIANESIHRKEQV